MTNLAPPPAAPAVLDVSGTPRTPFARLVKVEWRKMTDTRGGFWLLAVTGLLLLLTMGLVLLVVGLDDVVIDAGDLMGVFTIPLSLLMPVFGILIVTSEWSQRTALTTFTLEPHRLRVVLSKWVAVSLLAIATLLVAVLVGALTNVVAAGITGTDTQWNLEFSTFAWTVVLQLLYFWMAFGFGMVLLNTPGAISLYYVISLLLPFMVYSALFALFDWAQNVLPWVDLTVASTPIVSGGYDYIGNRVDVGALEYLQFGWTAVLWIGVPVALGIVRILRSEAK
jgi:ABC-2 type transport system permease protein